MYRHNRVFAPDCETAAFVILPRAITYTVCILICAPVPSANWFYSLNTLLLP